VSLHAISEKTAITTRTLRRDIADINEKLSDQGINLSGKSGLVNDYPDTASAAVRNIISFRAGRSLSFHRSERGKFTAFYL
ncbi:HTH domain-containing protein, partial [Pantoea agglomerans]